MKKTLIAVAAAAALTATSAFAEITFGAWLRVITGVGSNGEDVVMGTTNSWGGVRPARLNAAGTSEDGKAGFKLDFYFDNDEIWGHDYNIRIGDNGYLWVKPIDQIQLSIGKFDGGETGFRGDFCYGSWNWLRPYNWIVDDEGLTFKGSHKEDGGLMARITPIDNLVVLVQLPVMNAKWGGNNNGYVAKTETEDAKNTAADVFKNAAYMASYSIEGVGTLKAGFFGADDEKTVEGKKYNQTGTVNVAFDLNAIENLYVTVGAFFDIADKETGEWHEKMKFTAGASYQVSDAMKFSVSGGYVKYMDKCAWLGNKDNAFQIGAGVDYVIMDGLTLNADVRYKNVGYGKDKDDGSVSFLAGVVKSVGGNASLQAGFQGSTNGCGLVQADTGIPAVENDDFVWAIPVGLSVFF